MVKNCLVCNKEFYTYPAKVKVGKGKYCSRKCCLLITGIKKGQRLSPATEIKKGQKPWSYKGWRYAGRGKKYIDIHVGHRKYIREHRLVMEKHLGRKLETWEEIHHIDGDGLNNDINNLLLTTKSEHLKLEHKDGRYMEHLKRLHKGGGV